MCGGAAGVIGDGDGEGIGAVEIGVWCVGPDAGFGVDGRGTVAWRVSGFDGEIRAIGKAFCVCCGEGACDSRGIFCASARGIAGDDGWIINGVDGQADGLCGGATGVIGDGDGELIAAVEIGVGCVGPDAGFGVDGSGAVAWSVAGFDGEVGAIGKACLLYTSPRPRDRTRSRMPSSA